MDSSTAFFEGRAKLFRQKSAEKFGGDKKTPYLCIAFEKESLPQTAETPDASSREAPNASHCRENRKLERQIHNRGVAQLVRVRVWGA